MDQLFACETGKYCGVVGCSLFLLLLLLLLVFRERRPRGGFNEVRDAVVQTSMLIEKSDFVLTGRLQSIV